MADKRPSRKAELAAWLAEHKPARISEEEWTAIREALAPVSESHLRRLLRESGVPLAPLIEGVSQVSLDEAARTLLTLAERYGEADALSARRCRELVIRSKDHARLALRRMTRIESEDRRQLREEMILWMLTWLDNPAAFPIWLNLRRRVIAESY